MSRAATTVGQYLAVLVAAFTLNFLLPHLAPGDPVEFVLAAGGSLTEVQVEQVRAEFGLDRPLPVQYVAYWQDLVAGDLGTSVRFSQPVRTLLADRIGWTVLLAGTATLLSAVVGTIAGVWAARRRRHRGDLGVVVGVLGVDAMPAFWIGMVLLGVFAVQLGWVPSFGAAPFAGSDAAWLPGVLHRLVLPATTLVLATTGGVFLITRGATIATMDEPWVAMATVKGVGERRIALHHVLRPALLPTYTHLVLRLGAILGGTVVVETVFAYPGLGRLMFEAAIARDYPLLRGGFLLLTVGVVTANLVADLTYPLLDPRARRASRATP